MVREGEGWECNVNSRKAILNNINCNDVKNTNNNINVYDNYEKLEMYATRFLRLHTF